MASAWWAAASCWNPPFWIGDRMFSPALSRRELAQKLCKSSCGAVPPWPAPKGEAGEGEAGRYRGIAQGEAHVAQGLDHGDHPFAERAHGYGHLPRSR